MQASVGVVQSAHRADGAAMGALPWTTARNRNLGSSFLGVSVKKGECELRRAVAAQQCPCRRSAPGFALKIIQADKKVPQNEELPSVQPKRKKKPFVTPIKRGSHQRKLKARAAKLLPPKPLKAPDNGMLVEELIPVAHTVLQARTVLLDGVTRLLRHFPVKACRWCSEVHVAKKGHEIRSCQGKNSASRYSHHEWMPGYLDDIIMPLEVFHLADRLDKPPKHEARFDVDRIPAIVELCIQAGVDLPEHPTLRRISPIDPAKAVARDAESDDESQFQTGLGSRSSRGGGMKKPAFREEEEDWRTAAEETQDRAQKDPVHASDNTRLENDPGHSSIQDRDVEGGSQSQTRSEDGAVEAINEDDDLQTVAAKTLQAWDTMRAGASQLMKLYKVKACGYCPEVHIGPRGHKVKLCGAFKHQWRNGQHGWQEACLNDLIPPSLSSGYHKHNRDAGPALPVSRISSVKRRVLPPYVVGASRLCPVMDKSRYVWHVRDADGPPLTNSLKSFYGQAPAVVELCLQAGAKVPEEYKPRLRLDVIIPNSDEFEMVA